MTLHFYARLMMRKSWKEETQERCFISIRPSLRVKIGILPLSKKLSPEAMKVYEELVKYYNCEFDERGNIGKRYRRQDEIGTPVLCDI